MIKTLSFETIITKNDCFLTLQNLDLVTFQSLKVNNFYVGEGSDQTGVPTKFLTINSTAIVSIHNPATFFGIYITCKPVDLMFWEITVATGEVCF